MSTKSKYLEGYDAALAALDQNITTPNDECPLNDAEFAQGWNDCMAKMRVDESLPDPTYTFDEGWNQADHDLINGNCTPTMRFDPAYNPYHHGWNARLDEERGRQMFGRLIGLTDGLLLCSAVGVILYFGVVMFLSTQP